MTIRKDALDWLGNKGYPCTGRIFTSRMYPPNKSWKGKPRWWIEFSSDILSPTNHSEICLVLQKEENTSDFYLLKIPVPYLVTVKENLDYRNDKDRYSLIISLEPPGKFVDMRGTRIDFSRFLIKTLD